MCYKDKAVNGVAFALLVNLTGFQLVATTKLECQFVPVQVCHKAPASFSSLYPGGYSQKKDFHC